MQVLVRKNGKSYAVKRNMTLSEKIHARTNMRGNWDKVEAHNSTARVVNNLSYRR